VDEPTRAAGDTSLSLDAWHGDDRDGSEPQRVREARQEAAVEVCLGCPVMVQCDAYASSVVVEDGKARLAEPAGIWGGRLALERHRAFIRRRHEVAVPAPVRLVMTAQREAVLRALAGHTQPESVAGAAGVDVRTANWQRRRLVTMLALPQAVSRAGLLEAAVARGLLDASVVVADDGTVPAVPPPAAPSRAAVPVVPPVEAPTVIRGRVHGGPRRLGNARRRVTLGPPIPVGPGQLPMFDVPQAAAPVVPLHRSEPLETAA
jgi:hypothetical protein